MSNLPEPTSTTGDEAPLRRPLPSKHMSTNKQLQFGVDIVEYTCMHYASITRAKEKNKDREYETSRGPTTLLSLLKDRFHKGHHEKADSQPPSDQVRTSDHGSTAEKKERAIVQTQPVNAINQSVWESTVNSELYLASRVIRTAGWGSCFNLISADILGSSSSP